MWSRGMGRISLRQCFNGGTACHGISPSLPWKWGRGSRAWWATRRSHYGRKLPHRSGTGQAVTGLLSNWHCRSRSGTKTPSTTLCASRASIVVNLISTSMKKLFGRTVGVILQPLPGSFTAEPWNWDANNCSSTCRLKTTHKHRQTAGGWGLTRRHQHGSSGLWTCSNEERKLWWCCSFSTPGEYWSPMQRWKRSRWIGVRGVIWCEMLLFKSSRLMNLAPGDCGILFHQCYVGKVPRFEGCVTSEGWEKFSKHQRGEKPLTSLIQSEGSLFSLCWFTGNEVTGKRHQVRSISVQFLHRRSFPEVLLYDLSVPSYRLWRGLCQVAEPHREKKYSSTHKRIL